MIPAALLAFQHQPSASLPWPRSTPIKIPSSEQEGKKKKKEDEIA
jgi:hypothetical protein